MGQVEVRMGQSLREPATRVVVGIRTTEIRAAVFLSLAHDRRVELVASGSTASELGVFCRALQPDAVVVEEGLSDWPNDDLVDVTGLPSDQVLLIPSTDRDDAAGAVVVEGAGDLVSLILCAARVGRAQDQ